MEYDTMFILLVGALENVNGPQMCRFANQILLPILFPVLPKKKKENAHSIRSIYSETERRR